MSTPEQIAERFHEAYERLAPSFGYETRKASAKPWPEVPENNRRLMTAVAGEVLAGVLAELAASESLVTALQEQMARLAEQHTKAVAEAREEQREADAIRAERWFYQANKHMPSFREHIRATPLDSTPLADALERWIRDHGDLMTRIGEVSIRLTAAESALATEVERHQATAKERGEARDLVAQFEAGLSRGAALPAAVLIDRARRLLASLPADPREERCRHGNNEEACEPCLLPEPGET